MARLVDANVLVYRFDPRNVQKQRIALRLLEDGIASQSLVVPHQAIVELVAALTRPQQDLGNKPLMPLAQAIVEAEELIRIYPVLYPGSQLLLTAMRGAVAYDLSWFDAQIWAYAEVHGLRELLSEDFQHGRHYGNVRVVNPFASVERGVHELPPLYDT